MLSLRIGVAMGTDVIAACWGASHWQSSLSTGPTTQALRDAASELKRRIGVSRRVFASVAILPPLAQVKRIELPRMSDDDRRLAVQTNVNRYFVDIGGAPLCAVAALRRSVRASSVPFLAAATSASLVDDLIVAFAKEGFVIERIVPAHVAWTVDVLAHCRTLRRGMASIGVCGGCEDTVLELAAGSLVMTRRLRRSEMDGRLSRFDRRSGSALIGADANGPSAAVLAARGVSATRLLEIVSDSDRRARAHAERRMSRVLIAVACVCLVGAGMSYRWGLARELSGVVARRAALHAIVGRAIAARDSAQQLAADVAALVDLERSAPRWSAVLSRLSMALPEDADVTSFRAAADSVTVEGQAANAAHVFSALRKAPGVRSIGTTGPIRREASMHETLLEGWSLALRIDHDAAVTKR